ncbi:hypothetical protein BKA70DRAFT_115808 [Coprinopsis sp. MPI-PUGE-AT-0042]|nr:hypothetical protein BKA70DRAFT_115808 [Coprinopsis sp. MPI-PUGE-AT-0042]
MGDWEESGGWEGGLASVVRGSASLLKSVAELEVALREAKAVLENESVELQQEEGGHARVDLPKNDIPLAMEDIERVHLDEEGVGEGRDVGRDRGSASQEGCGGHSEERLDQPARCHPQRGSWSTRQATPALGTRYSGRSGRLRTSQTRYRAATNMSTNSTGEAISTATSSTVSRWGFVSLHPIRPRSSVGLLVPSLNLPPIPLTPFSCEAFQATGSLVQVMDGKAIRGLRAPNDGDIL